MKELLVSGFRRVFNMASKEVNAKLVSQIKSDLIALEIIAPLRPRHYIPWTRPALSPSALAVVLNDIVINQRSFIVELGGGISTLYIARLIQQQNKGALLTIEQDEEWLQRLNGFLEQEGLTECVTTLFAPLGPCDNAIEANGLWYQPDGVKQHLLSQKIDLLLVDGPSAGNRSRIRYPAAPFFKPYFQEQYAIVLDDTNRIGEKDIIQRWSRELDIVFQEACHGTSISLNGLAYNPLI